MAAAAARAAAASTSSARAATTSATAAWSRRERRRVVAESRPGRAREAERRPRGADGLDLAEADRPASAAHMARAASADLVAPAAARGDAPGRRARRRRSSASSGGTAAAARLARGGREVCGLAGRLFCGGTGDVGDVGDGGAFCIVVAP